MNFSKFGLHVNLSISLFLSLEGDIFPSCVLGDQGLPRNAHPTNWASGCGGPA